VTKITNDTIFDLQYADDVALPSHTPDGLQRQVDAISSAYYREALVVNSKKRKSTSHQIRRQPQPFSSVGIDLASLNSSRTWEVSLPPHVMLLLRFNIVFIPGMLSWF